MSKLNYKQIYAMKAERESRIKKICPNIPCSSGIYVFYRTDEAQIRRAYCGQAINLCERCASHLAEYDHIALSLKKHGFYKEDNPYGWKLQFKTCPKSELDEREVQTIKQFADAGFQMYNVTAGSQGAGKKITGDYKPPKTYREGIQAGKKSLARELSQIIGKHLTVRLKEEKQNNKTSQKQLEKFNRLLDEKNYGG
ncbi:MAG: GIY-YIG nuclease family protein [Lachnospiraceae bacterium]|nr:GIY-YIG nuclease family protein [Lachnospiraceae bacterium]